MSDPKSVEITKFIKRGRKDFDLTGFLLLELIKYFLWLQRVSGEPLCTETFFKGQKVSILPHRESTKYPLETPFSN